MLSRSLYAALGVANVLTEMGRELGLVALALRRSTLILRPPFREVFFRYYLMSGVESLGGVATRAAMLGTLIVAYVVNVLAADAESAIHLLESVVLREIGPVFAALIVMTKAGIEITGQLARMRERGEIDGLRLLGVPPIELLVVPCLLGVAAATVMLTLYFEILAVGSGLVISSWVANLSLAELAERFLMQFKFIDLVYALGKSVFFGLCLGAVACYHGLLAPMGRSRELPRLVSRGVMQSLFLISLLNAMMGYLVNGVLLFGIVRG
jgi:phospholipid/cholesterol/gamma-HCH transport system permease protein